MVILISHRRTYLEQYGGAKQSTLHTEVHDQMVQQQLCGNAAKILGSAQHQKHVWGVGVHVGVRGGKERRGDCGDSEVDCGGGGGLVKLFSTSHSIALKQAFAQVTPNQRWRALNNTSVHPT